LKENEKQVLNGNTIVTATEKDGWKNFTKKRDLVSISKELGTKTLPKNTACILM